MTPCRICKTDLLHPVYLGDSIGTCDGVRITPLFRAERIAKRDAIIISVASDPRQHGVYVHTVVNGISIQSASYASWTHALNTIDLLLMLSTCPVYICQNGLDALDRIKQFDCARLVKERIR